MKTVSGVYPHSEVIQNIKDKWSSLAVSNSFETTTVQTRLDQGGAKILVSYFKPLTSYGCILGIGYSVEAPRPLYGRINNGVWEDFYFL